jgi:hypothetical protein
MLLKIIEEISQYLKTNIPELQIAKRYKNEFEQNGNWTAEFPCILWRLSTVLPITFFSNGEIAKREMQIKLYVADKKTDEASVLNTIEKICDISNGMYLVSENFRILLKPGKINFHMYMNGVEVYILELSIEYWKE